MNNRNPRARNNTNDKNGNPVLTTKINISKQGNTLLTRLIQLQRGYVKYQKSVITTLLLSIIGVSVQASSTTLRLTPESFRQQYPALPSSIQSDDFHQFDIKKAEIGRLLFHDKLLSGNQNIACNTCHHENFGSGDGLSLGIGEGGQGVGPERTPGIGADKIAKRVPRNAQALWNLGHNSIHTLFHDGRLSKSDLYGNDFNTPAEEWLPKGFTHPLSAQAIFPLVAQFEMAGNTGENEVAGAIHDRIDAAWPIISHRVLSNAEYATAFIHAFDSINAPLDIDIVAVGEALGAFMGLQWQSFDSPFDQWLAGDIDALSQSALEGLYLFYGKGQCADCHSGPLFTDQEFYALGLPTFGPGRTRRFDPMPRDTGRLAESDDFADAYRFRTPPLRNITLTAPYGHNGAFPTLSGIIKHHHNPSQSRSNWNPELAALPQVEWLQKADFIIMQDALEMRRYQAFLDIDIPELSDNEVEKLVAFLDSLTGTGVDQLVFSTPDSVPSGLPVD